MNEKTYHEKSYPVYKIGISWIQDGEHDPKYPNWHKGLKDGRIRNGTDFSRMYNMGKSEDMTEDMKRFWKVMTETKQWWKDYKKRKPECKNPSKPKTTINFMGYESWCFSWFQHWTFDVGQTDEEALESFEEFVRSKEALNVKNGHMRHERVDDNKNPFYLLMGAEDRWRWSGGPDMKQRTDPPCRCKHCKKQGVIRINH